MADRKRTIRTTGYALFAVFAAGCTSSAPAEPVSAQQPHPQDSQQSQPSGATATPSCRDSPLAAQWKYDPAEGAERLELYRDIDRDGTIDTVLATREGGSFYSTTTVTFYPAGASHTWEFDTTVRMDTMTALHRVPDELAGAANADLRRSFEEILFSRTCPEIDPSLARLVGSDGPRWVDGEPRIASTYAHYSEEPALLALADDRGFTGSETVGTSGARALWVEYLSDNHRRAPDTRLTGTLRRVDSRDQLELWVTAHGVVAVDTQHDRHAWMFVYAGGDRKLRIPSVKAAKFRGDAVFIQLTGLNPNRRRVVVDLPKTAPVDN